MSTSLATAAFAQIVRPLKPWDDEGHVWAACIQDGQLTDDPELRNEGTNLEEGWTEIRLEYSGGGPRGGVPPIWTLVHVPPNGAEAFEVFRGIIPDRATFERLVGVADGVREHAFLLLGYVRHSV